jgi:hypothetical protein
MPMQGPRDDEPLRGLYGYEQVVNTFQRVAMILTHADLLFNIADSTAPLVFTGEFSE